MGQNIKYSHASLNKKSNMNYYDYINNKIK